MNADTTTTQSQNTPALLQKRPFWAALIVAVLLLGSGWIAFSAGQVADTTGAGAGQLEPAPIAGHPAPEIELPTLSGETIRLSDFRGQPVVVNFWATWCGPCRAEFPDFQEAAVDNADSLVIIGVNSTSTDQRDSIPPFLDEFGITFPIVLDEQGDAVDAYRVLGLPTTVFINSDGIINEVFTGPLNKAYIESKITELQAGL
ncbi:MAG: redoxin domain-containing protein [Anaerolineae bacterium]